MKVRIAIGVQVISGALTNAPQKATLCPDGGSRGYGGYGEMGCAALLWLRERILSVTRIVRGGGFPNFWVERGFGLVN